MSDSQFVPPPPGYGDDAVDEAFVKSIVPEGCIPLGFVAVVVWLDPDGKKRFFAHQPLDMDLVEGIGLLECVKQRWAQRVTGTAHRDDLDDDD